MKEGGGGGSTVSKAIPGVLVARVHLPSHCCNAQPTYLARAVSQLLLDVGIDSTDARVEGLEDLLARLQQLLWPHWHRATVAQSATLNG